MPYLVKVTDARHADYQIEESVLKRIGARLVVCNCQTEAEIIQQCADADALLLDMAPVTARVISALPNCKVINRYGVGYDNLDVEACTKHGIWACHVPDYCAQDVSDHALALLFSCLRQTVLRDRLVRQGQWNILPDASFRLQGKTLGVLGCGQIGRMLIQKTAGCQLSEVLVYDPYVSDDTLAALGAKRATLQDLLQKSDIVSLHMPVTRETTKIINRQSLSWMKPNAILINTSRGALIDDAALVEALQSGQIAFAGLDTHNTEPLPSDSPYIRLDRVVLTDHTAYNTVEGVRELKEKSAINIAKVLTGQAPLYPLNTPRSKGGSQ